jgi:hypothetical protein
MLGYGQPTELVHFRRIFDGIGSTYDVVKDMYTHPNVPVRNILEMHTRRYMGFDKPTQRQKLVVFLILVHQHVAT